MSEVLVPRVVVDIGLSLYFPAYVLTTDCGHRHLRPLSPAWAVGSVLDHCPFCGDLAEPPSEPAEVVAS